MEHYSIMDLKEALNIPFSEILEMVQSPEFPKSTINTAGKLTWKRDEIDDYLKSRRKSKIKE